MVKQIIMVGRGAQQIALQLRPIASRLGEVVVRAHPARPEDYQIVVELFLGTTTFSQQCRIRNPKEVRVGYNAQTRELTASADNFVPAENLVLSRQSSSCSRTFGRPLRERELVLGAVASFVARAAEKRRQGELAHVLTVVISKNRFEPDADAAGGHSRSAVLTLPVPSSDTRG